MKLRWKIVIGIVLLILGLSAFDSLTQSAARQAVAETRQVLREQGFKTDLAEFDFSTSPELQRREAALTNASFSWSNPSRQNREFYSFHQQQPFELMSPVTPESAAVVWQQSQLQGESGEDLWLESRALFQNQKEVLDAAVESAMSGPIRFELNASHGMAMLLRHLSGIKNLAQTLGQRAVQELHDGNTSEAWTNLLASTRLVSAWEVEPTEVSHLVRFGCAGIVFNSTWQMLQTNVWTDAQLSQLQREWESVDFFKALPETMAFSRAGSVASCELERNESITGGMTLIQMARYPRDAWNQISDSWRRRGYLTRGIFEDEKALLLFYRDRELEFRDAIQSSSWMTMQTLPGVTNLVAFRSKYPSRIQSMMNMRQLQFSFMQQGQGFLGSAVATEARRRLIITAIALERYQRQHGSYPKALTDIVENFPEGVPTDFIDGQPLRYRHTDDGHFVLWSVGLDGHDNGGRMAKRKMERYEVFIPEGRQAQQTSDLVWPRPATVTEMENFRLEQIKAESKRTEDSDERAAHHRWDQTERRQALAEKILATIHSAKPQEPKIRGQLLSDLLRNKTSTTTNHFTLDEMLTLKQIVTGSEPETATFEFPISYDALTNLGSLHLFIDPNKDEDSDDGCSVGWLECKRATNGNCLLVWDTIYESPGKHALQAGILLEENPPRIISASLEPFSSASA